MRVFVAGATGAVGRRLLPLLLEEGHAVTGTTRSADRARELERAGVTPVVVDAFDAPALTEAVGRAAPEIIIHQLTDLPREFDPARLAAAGEKNARLRVEGTRNLISAARAASVRRLIVQSIAFGYAPGHEPHPETDPLNLADPVRALTVKAIADMEQQVLTAPNIDGILLRYGLFYGPGTWSNTPDRRPALHIDAAAQAARLAVTRGSAGIYNIADEDGVVSIEKARSEIGFVPHFRLAR